MKSSLEKKARLSLSSSLFALQLFSRRQNSTVLELTLARRVNISASSSIQFNLSWLTKTALAAGVNLFCTLSKNVILK